MIEGILPLLKPAGMTSHDCVMKLRKLLRTKKIGHTGTLDPEVTGVLPICVGRATKIAQYLSDYAKSYEAEVTIGQSTTTEDRHGEIVETRKVEEPLERETVEAVLRSFVGDIEQTPPMYSAVKINGKKLYEYARQGIEIERPARTVHIYSIDLISKEGRFEPPFPSFAIRVTCSKGTYVRTLAVDIGKKLGFPAHMSRLVRTASGPFQLNDCVTFEELETLIKKEEVDKALFPIEKGLEAFEKLIVNREIEAKIRNGAVLPLSKEVEHSPFAVYNEKGACLALYQKHPTKPYLMKPEKILNAQ
ncbi:tRNA pseudouridine(55) synthase TruB [Fictibacillus sp. Mic-4]|uniref:tRNA pseudouridine(55) synthase TruB n=1 Tax=Fictibacillus TaxID=1329200 RepID=UPI0004014D7B|nr:tRNA pseudouridine(55) synthase TruB [Fictibacillus gelatini]